MSTNARQAKASKLALGTTSYRCCREYFSTLQHLVGGQNLLETFSPLTFSLVTRYGRMKQDLATPSSLTNLQKVLSHLVHLEDGTLFFYFRQLPARPTTHTPRNARKPSTR